MNKIFICNNKYYEEFYLNFKFDILSNLTDNKYFKFEILNINELKIYWYENEEILYTEDSYLYFLNKDDIKKIKKVHFYHPEWKDQCIMNYYTNKLSRINCSSETGTFEYKNDKLIVKWDKWDLEIYDFFDEYSYYKSDYLNTIESVKISNNNNNYIFIHVCCLENWKEIFEDIINNIINSKLYNNTIKIFIGIVGNITYNESIYFSENHLDYNKKFSILYINENVHNYEILTINSIKTFCLYNNNSIEKDANILYIHTKGVRNAGNKECTISWRKMMEFNLIENYEKCLLYLNYYDIIGNNIINTFDIDDKNVSVNGNHNYHYSGNFWWSKKSYIKNLKYLDIDNSETSILTRCKAENWICSNYPDSKIGIIFNDDTNIHPYHKYVFDYYKKLYFTVKEL